MSDVEEHIDKSQWVEFSEKDPLIKPERLSKGDLHVEYKESGEFHFAQLQVKSLLNFLFQSSIITSQQHDDGHVFQAWRDQHRVALGLQRPVSGQVAESSSTKLRAYGFVLLLRKLNAGDHKIIERAVDTICNEHTRWMASRNKEVYRRVFGILEKIIVPIREQIGYLENLNDEEREALSAERLKELLANKVNNK